MTLLKPDSLQVNLPLQSIARICQHFEVEELKIFGSVLRGDFSPKSDIDFLVKFLNDDAGEWGCKYSDMADELTTLLGRKAEVVSQRAVEQSDNYLRRKRILTEAKTIYVT